MPESVSSLVKYCSVDTALKILHSGHLRWSAPSLLGDPFELSHKTEPDFNAGTLLDALIRQVVVMLFGPEAPSGYGSRLLATIKRWRDEERFASEEEAISVLRGLLGQLAEAQARLIDNYLSEWRQFARHIRINCFVERHTSLHCWERYADNHCGVALRFAAGPGSLLEKAQKVRYNQQAPVITSLKEQLEILFGQLPPLSPKEFTNKLLVKSRHLQQEAEWRSFVLDDHSPEADESCWYTDQALVGGQLEAVYLGAVIPHSEKEQIVSIVEQRYPDTRVFQAAPQQTKFELDFSPIGTA